MYTEYRECTSPFFSLPCKRGLFLTLLILCTGHVFAESPEKEAQETARIDIVIVDEIEDVSPAEDELACTAAESTPHLTCTANPATGCFGVSPMLLPLAGKPGQTLTTSVALQNMGAPTPTVTLTFTHLKQNNQGQWLPETHITPDERSCRDWITSDLPLTQPIPLPVSGKITCPLTLAIPEEAEGAYTAAILIQPQKDAKEKEAFDCLFVVPILINVGQGATPTVSLGIDSPHDSLAMVNYSGQKDLRLHPWQGSGNPYRHYTGQCPLGLVTNIPTAIFSTISPCSPAEGNWYIDSLPNRVNGPSQVLLDVKVTDLAIEKLPGGAQDVKVAKVTVQIMPALD